MSLCSPYGPNEERYQLTGGEVRPILVMINNNLPHYMNVALLYIIKVLNLNNSTLKIIFNLKQRLMDYSLYTRQLLQDHFIHDYVDNSKEL